MKKLYFLLAILFVIAGCASMGSFPHVTGTQVNLEKRNYRIVKANANGASSGFSLLGIIPITTPQHTVAMSRLYENAGFKEGAAYGLANVVQENTSTYLILFSIPTYRVRADMIEFVDEGASK